MLLFYIRHGNPTYEPDALTPLGKREAEAVAKRLAVYGMDRIFNSTSNRAIETAKPLCELLQKPLEQLEFAKEDHAFRDFSVPKDDGRDGRCWVWSSHKYVECFLSPDVCALGDRWYEHPDFAGMTFARGVDRVAAEADAWLASLGYEHDRERHLYRPVAPNDGRVALFAHAGFGFAFLSSILDIPYPTLCTRFDMRTSGMTVIDFRQAGDWVRPVVLTYSSDSHIYREGLPLLYNGALRF